MGFPNETIAQLRADAAAEEQAERALRQGARDEARVSFAESRKVRTRHLHPADDPWTKTCRTLCGKIVEVDDAIAPRAAHASTSFDLYGCADCWALLMAWKVSGNKKPLTYRRLNAWPGKDYSLEEEVMNVDANGQAKKSTPRERAIGRAMEVRRVEVGARGAEEDGIFVFLGELLVTEHERAHRGASSERLRVKALTVELVRLKPSSAVLRALQGAP